MSESLINTKMWCKYIVQKEVYMSKIGNHIIKLAVTQRLLININ
jgi:hypothetical protein